MFMPQIYLIPSSDWLMATLFILLCLNKNDLLTFILSLAFVTFILQTLAYKCRVGYIMFLAPCMFPHRTLRPATDRWT